MNKHTIRKKVRGASFTYLKLTVWVMLLLCIGLPISILVSNSLYAERVGNDWGFFAHRLINRLAVFTLPSDMLELYKPEIEFLTDHAVDPDKRRYSSPHEAVRHYIDLDHFGSMPFIKLPRNRLDAILLHCKVRLVGESQRDTLSLYGQFTDDLDQPTYHLSDHLGTKYELDHTNYRHFFTKQVLPSYYEAAWEVDCIQLDSLVPGYEGCYRAVVEDSLTPHGVLPYHLVSQLRTLTHAFEIGDARLILRFSADIGHYLADAHVPLHTTSNYNGQLTDQLGIHAFWESRIPELYATNEFDFLVGKAKYIRDPTSYFWDVVLTSHAHVDSVLLIEKDLSQRFSEDQQYCFTERNHMTVRTQCEAYARAYHERMQGMVESRFRSAIKAIGSVWYTAWVDAGQPDLAQILTSDLHTEGDSLLNKAFQENRILGREH